MRDGNDNGASNHEFLTIKQGAAIVGMNQRWLYDRIGKKGGPPYKRRGRYIKLPREKFIVWAEQDVIP
jgi:predicted DNA-binding transcriptional regulator AlpA